MDKNLLLRLHRSLLRIRVVEEAIARLYPEQEMRCPVHLCTGQEAVAAGACAALAPRDYVLSGHRSHGHYLAKGGDLGAMIAELYGKATGCARGKGGSMHLVDLAAGFLGAAPIVGSTIPIAVGTAFGSAMRGEDRVTMVFFGDGAVETGVFHESLNFAALKRLAVVFVCENNLYSVHSPMAVRQPEGRAITALAAAQGLEAAAGDGNDAEAVHALARAAVERARAGAGPSLLEFATYRWREHCGPNLDGGLGYREEAELLAWQARDPLPRLEARLIAAGIAERGRLERIAAELEAEMAAAVAFAKASPFPAPETATSQVYAS